MVNYDIAVVENGGKASKSKKKIKKWANLKKNYRKSIFLSENGGKSSKSKKKMQKN